MNSLQMDTDPGWETCILGPSQQQAPNSPFHLNVRVHLPSGSPKSIPLEQGHACRAARERSVPSAQRYRRVGIVGNGLSVCSGSTAKNYKLGSFKQQTFPLSQFWSLEVQN